MDTGGGQWQPVRSEDGDIFRSLLDEDCLAARGADAECKVHVATLDRLGGEGGEFVGGENADLGGVTGHVGGDGILGEDFG